MLSQTMIDRSSSMQPAIHANRAAPPVSARTPATSINLMGAVMPFARNAEIYGENEPAEYLYKVVSGAVRSYKVLSDGRRQIGGFYLPGDVFCLEAGDVHGFSAEAVADSKIMVIKRAALIALAARDNEVARQLWTMSARELQRAQDHVMLLIKTAQERVAGFLLEMSDRIHGRNEVELPMSRQDIADYLGLTIETVSRLLTKLKRRKIMSIARLDEIHIHDVCRLCRLSGTHLTRGEWCSSH